MVSHRWQFLGKTDYSLIYVDHKAQMTRIVGNRYIYYHDGIYPYHNPDYVRKFQVKR